ncbi:UbiD family decarboxylase [Streptomyces sp. RKAG293]|uniref:UbiD family decarboxylase n=1 Tax=Streptomyces sp. RKAG293 TaxID=2893403 RepID=UPI0020334535|nr:UbiD family decarboxylase [Streptomyces sp. RKAG293]MCM2417806.1 UbiD family decarboxylase [Streptomyces sp. RKAG293]
MKKHLTSLRAYLEELREIGDLREIDDEVSTELEAGAVIRYAVENQLPAPLFNRLAGHRPGYRILGAPGALSSLPEARWARVALSLGLEPGTHPLAIVDELAVALDAEPIPPVEITDAPCQQNVLLGDEATLDAFPVPLVHVGDAGRYLNTWGVIIVRSPDGSWTNWAITRVMAADSRTLVVMINPPQDIGKIYAMWKERGEPMPAALVQGSEPAIPFAGGMALPSGRDESGYLGGYFGEPLEVTRCRTVDLQVPASAEIVVEGHVSLDETLPEGPMGEFFGYISGQPRQRPVFHISAITHRDDPILPVVSAGKPVEEVHTVVGPTHAAEVLRNLRGAGLPVTAAWLIPEGSCTLAAITVPREWRQWGGGIHTTTRMLTRAIANVVLRPKVGFWITRILVLDDDLDPTDLRDLAWGFATRCHPVQGQVLIEDQLFTPLHIIYSAAEMQTLSGPKMAYDCLLSPDADKRPVSTAFEQNFPEHIKRRARALWDRPGS